MKNSRGSRLIDKYGYKHVLVHENLEALSLYALGTIEWILLKVLSLQLTEKISVCALYMEEDTDSQILNLLKPEFQSLNLAG